MLNGINQLYIIKVPINYYHIVIKLYHLMVVTYTQVPISQLYI